MRLIFGPLHHRRCRDRRRQLHRRAPETDRRSDRGKACRRALRAATALSAFLAFGMTPLTDAPTAQADEFDIILDPLINSLSNIDPTVGAAVSALVTSFDPTFASDHAATAAALVDPGALPASASPDLAQLLNEFVYSPMHTGIEDWINSSLGQQTDSLINTAWGSYVLGDGMAGTQADPTGGAGGWLFGDGGAGWNSTEDGVGGGDGGAAGIFGDGERRRWWCRRSWWRGWCRWIVDGYRRGRR